jgi:RNA polymerase sigma-70 factor, ECF subfamily
VTDDDEVQRFNALYSAHSRQVYGYAVSRGLSQNADEIVSETFLAAWCRVGELPEYPLPWLLGVARNLIRNDKRRFARQMTAEERLRSWTAADDVMGADPAEVVTDRDGVLAALSQLPDGDREVLTLMSWHGFSRAEAAEVMGCSSVTFAVKLHRARRRLEQALGNVEEPRAHRNIHPLRTFAKDAAP